MSDTEWDPGDRYGMPEGAFKAAFDSHRPAAEAGIIRMGMYVPTRGEVRSMSPGELYQLLDMWFWESPTELIPSREMIEMVRFDLEARPDKDFPSVRTLIHICDEILSPYEPKAPPDDLNDE